MAMMEMERQELKARVEALERKLSFASSAEEVATRRAQNQQLTHHNRRLVVCTKENQRAHKAIDQNA